MRTNDKHEAVSRIAGPGSVLIELLAVALICTAVSLAQSSAASASMPSPPAAKTPPTGPHEVTKVHGYWVIDVRNADGKVAKHMEFENQLCTSFNDGFGGNPVGGDSILSSLLAGTASAGQWSIVLGAPGPIANPPNCDIVAYAYLSQGNPGAGAVGLPSSGAPTAVQPYGIPAALSCSLQADVFVNGLTNTCIPFLVESPAPAGQVGINLSVQFGPSESLTISAVGTQLYTCAGSPGPPRPVDCKNIGRDSENLAGQGTPCIISGSPSRLAPVSPITTTWVGCIPGDPSTNSVSITSYMVDDGVGQNPFSGVVLTGTGGVPGPFTVSPGQTLAITWSLTFQ
jgi:hypothetical protein